MKKYNLLLLSALLLPLPPAAAQETPPAVSTAAAAPASQPVSYDFGMAQRKAGDHAGARETFLKLLEQTPDGNGGLEGLALACISLKRYGEARETLERWNAKAPGNPYILGLLLRAQSGDGDEDGVLRTNRALAAADPRDCAARGRVDAGMERLEAGVFPRGRTYKSYSIEGLNTASPQRLLYEGSSAGARFRAPLRPGLDLIGGMEVREEAQRNDGRGFTYYDMLEQIYSAGLGGRAKNLRWEAEYGQSLLSDAGNSSAVGRNSLGRLRLYGERAYGPADYRLTLNSQPRFVRGSGTSRYFVLMRENSARAEADAALWGWEWLTRAGLYSTSDGTALGTFSLRGIREIRPGILQAGYSHGQQEFYGASSDNKLRYVNADRVSLGLRRGEEEKYRAGVSLAQTFFSDNNRLAEADAEAAAWLPRNKEFSGTYRFSLQDFRGAYDGYNSVDERSHWLGVWWRRCRGLNWSAAAGYEKGFVRDQLLSYQANQYTASLDWFRGPYASVRLQLLKRDSAGRGKGYSAGFQARYSFE